MFIVVLRPDEKCYYVTFLPDFVPCAPCAGALTALRHRGRLYAAPVAVQAGSAAGGSPAPRFKFSGQTKNVAGQHFCRTSFLVLRAQAHSPHCVTEGACTPHLSPYKRDLPQGAPLHPVFSLLRPDEKCCCATFLPDSVPCAPCSGALTAPRHRGRLSTEMCVYLSSRSGRRSRVISSDLRARHASTSA